MTAPRDDTIFALSSGAPPAGIAVIRISGSGAGSALRALTGSLPVPRRASLRAIRWKGELLDRALILWLPGPSSATGEDVAELHLHGGRAVVAGVEAALAAQVDMRRAEPGEFTRRALYNGRIDLTAAEGLADLLAAETAMQRRAALAVQDGALAHTFAGWRTRLLDIAAQIEGGIDLAEEGEAGDVPLPVAEIAALAADIQHQLAHPPAERLRDGVRIVLAGPVNAGKSTLLNVLVGRDAAIATPIPGTTRDIIEVPVSLCGRPLVFVDTAGLRDATDVVEAEGIARAHAALDTADLVLWLGDQAPPDGQAETLWLHARADVDGRREPRHESQLAISATSGLGLDDLRGHITQAADNLLPRDGEATLNQRHREVSHTIFEDLTAATLTKDAVLMAEHVRSALGAMARLTGGAGVENILDAMFSRFCVGK